MSIPPKPGVARSVWSTYALTMVIVAACIGVRYVLDPWMGDRLPLVTLFGGVAATVWIGGYRPATVAALLGYLGCSYLFIEPRYQFALVGAGEYVGLAAYLFTCALIILIGEVARRAQAEAHRQRELSRITLRSIGDAVISTDVDGRVTYMNAVAESLTGWTEAEALGQPLQTVFHIVNEQSRAPVENPAVRALRDGIVAGLANHTMLIRRDGSECPIDDSAAPIRDESSAISGCVLIFRDVSAQRRMEREKADQLMTARLLASIVETSDDAIISKSLDGIIQTWNAGAQRLFGYSAAEAVGRHISILIPQERLAEEDEIVARLEAGDRVDHFETERVRADGTRLRVSLTISPIIDAENHVIGASKIVRDVTHQRQAEQRELLLLAEAAAANAKVRAFFEQGAMLAGLMDVNGTVLDVNRVAAEGCGYTKEDIVGKPFWEGPWWSQTPSAKEHIEAVVSQARDGEVFRGEMPYVVATGEERVADFTIQPIKDDEDRVLALGTAAVDVTDRKRAEADRERFADNLTRLALDLSEADRRKTEFLAMLAHELRNPLAPISNAVKALRLSAGDAVTLNTVSGVLERQVAQMARLVDDLLDVSRITRGKIELRKERVELAPVVEQAMEAVSAQYRTLHHDLSVSLPPDPIYVDADPARLAQVVSNLLNNAAKFTEAGGHIRLTVGREGDQATIRVRDNGIGLAPEHVERVFEMFAQVDTSLERSRDGLGIGLTLVKTLVEMHGGTISVHSDGIGRGAEFAVHLPIAVHATHPGPEPAAAMPAAVSRRILVVDDSQDAAASLAMLLQFGGHETQTANDGYEAIAVAERWRPNVVLLDIGLPRMSGYETCRRIRQQPWGREMLLVALTGWGQEEDRQRSEEAGFNAHVVKPPDYDELMRLIAWQRSEQSDHRRAG